MPLLPGFQGEIDSVLSITLKAELYFEYCTISRGGCSIIEQLKKEGITPSDYINFYGLRQHGKSQNNVPATEIVYIHSKLLIVDDEIALIGSANINDRSLNGDRDSELAIIVEDQTKVDSFMNGAAIKVPKFSHTLRATIFGEHFGLSYEQVKDPLSIQLENEIKIRTSTNTQYYRQIFRCYPDDEIKKAKDYDQFLKNKKIDDYDKLSIFIKGFAVEFPLEFLCEDLKLFQYLPNREADYFI